MTTAGPVSRGGGGVREDREIRLTGAGGGVRIEACWLR